MAGPVSQYMLDQTLEAAAVTLGGPAVGAIIGLWTSAGWAPTYANGLGTNYDAAGANLAGEPAGPGYARLGTLFPGPPTTGVAGHEQITGNVVTFLNATTTNYMVYGYSAWSVSGANFLGAVAFGAGIAWPIGGTLPVIPVLQAISEVYP